MPSKQRSSFVRRARHLGDRLCPICVSNPMHSESSSLPAAVELDPRHPASAASQQGIGEILEGANRPLPSSEADEAEILQASIKAGSVAQIVIAGIAVIGLIYLLKLVMVTTLFSILMAFILEPAVRLLCRMRIPEAGRSFAGCGL